MDKIILKDFLIKYWKNIAILILAILVFQQCNSNSELIISSKQHKETAKKYLKQSRIIKQNLNNEIKVYKSEIKRLNFVNEINEKNLSQNTKLTKAKLSDLRHYSASDYTKYFKCRYNSKIGVIQTVNGTILKDTISKKVITDLIIGDGAKSEVKILREIAKVEKLKFETADKTIDSLNIGINELVKTYESANSEKDKAINNIEKAFKKERNKNKVWKIIATSVMVGSGYLLLK